ncbi:hypothetical protein ACFLV0_06755 [Chloroflexota bacterium]
MSGVEIAERCFDGFGTIEDIKAKSGLSDTDLIKPGKEAHGRIHLWVRIFYVCGT